MTKKERRDAERDPRGRQWLAQIDEMVKGVRTWLVNNPDSKPIITFTIPRKIRLVTDLDNALSSGVILVDKEGQRMLDELGWTADTPDQPTFFMVRTALESALNK